MRIQPAIASDRSTWNRFVKEEYPPVGAFMQTWEWADFQEMRGRKVYRFFVREKGKPVALFTLVIHDLPLGFSYGYVPRGPVMSRRLIESGQELELMRLMKEWLKKNFSKLIFVRLEPPLEKLDRKSLAKHGFKIPTFYVQPRDNIVMTLDQSDEALLASLHSTTRSNIPRAEKRGVEVRVKHALTEGEYETFFRMMEDTLKRNGGKNVYPEARYFKTLLKAAAPDDASKGNKDSAEFTLATFLGTQNGEPAATHIVVFFADTATYLFGASYTDKLNSKVSTYLHWKAAQYAKAKGCRFYDLGGVDDKRWPSISKFKRQFGGCEYHYIGNVDVIFRPVFYWGYGLVRRLRRQE